jgi:glucose-1-phosphate cytidylyltransferase
MKVVILAGGLGSRLSEETETKPKPMVGIGDHPILWHIMKIYSAHGLNDFIICTGYKGFMIKEYFSNYFLHTSDVTFDIANNSMEVHQRSGEPWKVTVVDTGAATMTGGRLKRVQAYLGDEDFCLTYGDGLANVDIKALLAFHQAHGKLATVTAVQPTGRFGAMVMDGDKVQAFMEKPKGDGGWINGGFFVFSPKVLKHIAEDATVLEQEPLQALTQASQLHAYQHRGFWQPMDTIRDRQILQSLWESGEAPWKIWK